jgi:hypothetical protein
MIRNRIRWSCGYALSVGYALEWLVARPIHALVSQPELEPIFGHKPIIGVVTEDCQSSRADNAPPPLRGPSAKPADVEAAPLPDDAAPPRKGKTAAEEAARAAARRLAPSIKELQK